MNAKTTLKKIIFLVFFPMLLVCSIKTNAQSTQNYAPGRVIAKFKNDVPTISNRSGIATSGITAIDALNAKYTCSSLEKLFPVWNEKAAEGTDVKLNHLAILKFPVTADLQSIIKEYTATGLFEYIEPDYIGSHGGTQGIDMTPNDTYFASRQWSLLNKGTFADAPGKAGADIKMTTAWDITTGSASIIIGIIDGGCRLGHPEFSGRIWAGPAGEIAGNGIDDDGNGFVDDTKGGWDFVNNDNDPTDDQGHGTNVAGIIGANGNNGSLYAGVNWKSKLMIVKGTDASGNGLYSYWVSGIHYCADNGAKVINMSLGGSSFSQALQDAVTYAWQKNVLSVICMQNYNTSTPYYPAACTHAFAVGATTSSDQRAVPFALGEPGSNYGAHIKVVAPGDRIYGLDYQSNTNANTYWCGTSQATPHATGVASLIYSLNPNFTPDQVMNIIETTADDQVGKPAEDIAGWDQYYGYGRINATRALQLVTTSINTSTLLENTFNIYPNPFSSSVTINYTLTSNSAIKIEFYNLLGELVSSTDKGTQPKGTYTEALTPEVGKGIYFVALAINEGERKFYKVVKQ